ncbi:MAG: protein kinase [Candidatus Solibacter usitatus]|nr:protein kinase [Candidatus Solibacter usitatus]
MVGSNVTHYRILEKLGAGGMGVVYKAHDTKLDRLVALKFLPPHASADPDEKHRFLHEARAASALDHPNIGVVHEIDETRDGQLFIVMAYYPGETLKQRIARAYEKGETLVEKVAAGLPVAEALDLASQIARGLERAHANGIVHRDIKPANVIVTSDGVAKIIDFGLAKLSDATATVAHTTKGTAGYMSPEQALGKDVDARTDVWSLGVALYEMLAGELPFRGQHQAALMHSILHDDPKPLRESRPDTPEELERVAARALEKDVARRYPSAGEMARDLAAVQATLTAPAPPPDLKQLIRRPRYAIPAFLGVALLVVAAILLVRHNARLRWAREQALPEAAQLAAQGRTSAAFRLAQQAEPYIPSDPALTKLWEDISVPFTFDTDPPGAEVEIKDYSETDGGWTKLGVSPIKDRRVPRVFLRWRVSKPGFSALQGARNAWGTSSTVKIEPEGSVPPGMVRVLGGSYTVNVGQVGQLPMVRLAPYLIDKYEVTNRQYKEFMDRGGYQKQVYWKHKFVRAGRALSWEEAIAQYRDSTGRPGPAAWEGGRYPDGQADYPVAGVSWYEAAAYAEFAGKSLPTVYHWYKAADPGTAAFVGVLSNFSRSGPAAVGKHQGIGPNGTYDMAGNVKEWCWTETGGGLRFILGGGWNEPMYQFVDADARDPFDRSAQNGFRCIRTVDPPGEKIWAPQQRVFRDYGKEKPVSEETFRIFQGLYAYDKTDLKPRIESADDSAPEWRREKVSINAAYGGERVPIYLFLPKNASPPYQAVVYCPGAGALRVASSQELFGLRVTLDFVIKSGRAVVYPVYKDMYERRGIYDRPLTLVESRDRIVAITKDLGRTVDYLETRKEFDSGRLAYMGSSFGASHGVIWSTIEERLKTSIYLDGGFFFSPRLPDADAFNFAPRMRRPVLMINGRYDFTFPLETSQRHLFRLLGTPEKDKKHVLFDTAHDVGVKRTELVREVLDWLDKYLGKVQ